VEVGSGEGRGLEEGRDRMEMRNPIPRRSERRGIWFPPQKAGFSFEAYARAARFTFQAGWSGNEFMNMNTTTNKQNQSRNQSRVSRDEVAQQAYQLWEAAGQPAGRDLEYWLQAESELLASNGHRPTTVSATAGGPEREIADAPVPAMHEPGARKLESRKVASTFRGNSGERRAPTLAGSKIR